VAIDEVGTTRILVVDDDEDLAEITSECLSEIGYRVTVAFDIAQAKSILAANLFEIVITDLTLPDGGGVELIEWMNDQPELGAVNVIVSSGHADFDAGSLKGRKVEFLPKPYTRSQLEVLCAGCLVSFPKMSA
jgi:two-component system, NtrC family, response regulator PilR